MAKEDTVQVTYYLRDIKNSLVKAWQEEFQQYSEDVKVSCGDIFKDAPAVDAIVSPANSFGFMDGGIDLVYSRHFGWKMQQRLQEIIRNQHNGEVLVGQCVIMPAYPESGISETEQAKLAGCNGGKPIKFLISAPTMRVPLDVSDTANAYLAFRGVILAVQKHNATEGNEPIRSVLCPGLGTAVGLMPPKRCAHQMRKAYETYELGQHQEIIHPRRLDLMYAAHKHMSTYGPLESRPPTKIEQARAALEKL